MFSAFRMGAAASGRKPCDIDRVLLGVTRSHVKKIGTPGTTGAIRYGGFQRVSNFTWDF